MPYRKVGDIIKNNNSYFIVTKIEKKEGNQIIETERLGINMLKHKMITIKNQSAYNALNTIFDILNLTDKDKINSLLWIDAMVVPQNKNGGR